MTLAWLVSQLLFLTSRFSLLGFLSFHAVNNSVHLLKASTSNSLFSQISLNQIFLKVLNAAHHKAFQK